MIYRADEFLFERYRLGEYGDVAVINADVMAGLRLLPDESVQCVVTSPPYWGLRDYGIAGQIGLERTPEEYVARMVGVFREVKRVLRSDGTLWLNLGDSYAGSGRGRDADGSRTLSENGCKQETNRGAVAGRLVNSKSLSKNLIEQGAIGNAWVAPPAGYKAKDLIGIPWRVAFALQADGWWLRCDIIWAKPNPMPESVTDRPTKSHEYIFLMTKSSRYYYDAEAIVEKAITSPFDKSNHSFGVVGGNVDSTPMRKKESGKNWQKRGYVEKNQDNGQSPQHHGVSISTDVSRNKRSVWTVATQPYKEAHFATFPEDLIKPCVLAGSRKGDVVLDPFGGAMTTALVAKELSRRAIMVELKAEYCQMGEKRLRQEVLKI